MIKKKTIVVHLRGNKNILYNFVIAEYIVRDVMAYEGDVDHINLYLDRSMSESSREAFDRCFAEELSWKTFVSGNDLLITSNIFNDYSHQQPCLQVVDYIAGSSFQLFERSKSRYYGMVKAKVIRTHSWGV